jgi:hypothetical protein
MSRHYVDEDEWWPVYTIVDDPFHYLHTVELTEEQHQDYLDVMDRFKQWQGRLKPKTQD